MPSPMPGWIAKSKIDIGVDPNRFVPGDVEGGGLEVEIAMAAGIQHSELKMVEPRKQKLGRDGKCSIVTWSLGA